MPEIKPSKIRIEASSVCQLRCPSCPRTTEAFQTVIGNGFLKFSDFKMLIDKNLWIKEIELSNYGEIFLNPEILEIIKYAYNRDVALRADNGTNLNNVSEDILESLVRYKFRSMTCAIDGASNETYKVYRVKGDFDTVIQNIKKLNLFKQQYKSRYPQLTWQFVPFGHNEHEIELAREMANSLDMNFHVNLTWDDGFSPLRNPEHTRKIAGAASREEYKRMYGVDYKRGICRDLWDAPQINWDGKILGCSRNFWGDFGGNAFISGLYQSINSDKIKYARDMVLGKKPERDDIPCTTCDLYINMKADGRWLTKPSFLMRAIYSFARWAIPAKYHYNLKKYKTRYL